LPFPIDFDGRPYNTLTLPCDIFSYSIVVVGVKIVKIILMHLICIFNLNALFSQCRIKLVFNIYTFT